MGFGIALFGYAFLLLNEIGGGLFGGLLLAYGLFLASRLEIGFAKSAVAALFMTPRGVLQLVSAFGIIDLNGLPTLNTVTFFVYMAAWLISSYYWLTTVAEIAKRCNAKRFEQQARTRLLITVAFIVFVLVANVLAFSGVLGGYTVSGLQYILQYAVIIMNTIFMHTCFVLITSEKQYAKDRQDIAKERAKSLEKTHKEQQEAAEKIEKYKK